MRPVVFGTAGNATAVPRAFKHLRQWPRIRTGQPLRPDRHFLPQRPCVVV